MSLIRKVGRRLFEVVFLQPGPIVRYLLPVLMLVAAIGVQILVSLVVPKGTDFPYTLFFLVAIAGTAWFGGYLPGAVACLLTMVGIPMLATPGFHVAQVDPSRLVLLTGLSMLVSLVAQSQRKQRALLRQANAELDERVRTRTQELAKVVDALKAEVTQHQVTEKALRRSESRVDLALEASGIGRWDVDLLTGEVTRSDRHNQILGQGQDATSREGLFDRVLPEDRQAVEEKFQHAVETGGVCEFECRIRDNDGNIRWVWGRGKALKDETGRPVSLLGSSTDITDRKTSEQKLQTQLARLNLLGQITRAIGERQDLRSIFQVVIRTLEEGLPLAFGCVCLYDPNAEEIVVDCIGTRSEALATELALTQEAHIGIAENGLTRCVRGQLIYEPDVNQTDFPFSQKLARSGLRSMVAAPLSFESKIFGALITARHEPGGFSSGECEFLRQLSEHVALAAQQAETYGALEQAYEDLRQTQQTVMQQERLRALGQMASGIAHDINNAISPITLYTEMLLEQEPNLSARTRDFLEMTQRAIGDVAHTVSSMREFYRQREPEMVLVPVQLNVLMQQVIDLSRARWFDMPQQRGIYIELQMELEENLPAVAGVESEIREALLNLVFNAVDAMPSGGKLILSTTALKSQQVEIAVRDTGIGMSEETRRRCLEPFYTTKGERGSGLGLAMVYGAMRRHNADIELNSAVGEGTTIRLKFPVPTAEVPERSADLPVAIPSRLRILNVDDDPLLIKSLRDALEGDGHTVHSAYGGQEGIDAFLAACQGSERFDVVITDLGMPYIDGRKVASAIKSNSPSTPVVLLTGWGQRLVAEGDIPPHVDRVLTKPPKLRDLRTALADLTGQGRPEVVQGVNGQVAK